MYDKSNLIFFILGYMGFSDTGNQWIILSMLYFDSNVHIINIGDLQSGYVKYNFCMIGI